MKFRKTICNLRTSVILFLSILSVFAYQGCRKDIVLNSTKANTFASITEIKESYEKLAIESRTRDSLKSGLIIKYIPQWEHAKYSQINDSTQYTLIPLIGSGQLNEKEISVRTVNNTPFLVVANGKKFYLSRFYPDKKSDDNFLKNGKLSMIDVLNKKLFTYSYENGKSAYNAPKAFKSPKGSTKKAAYEVRCREEGTCVWSTYCHGVGYISTSYPGTCSYPTDYTDCDYSVSWSQDRIIYNTVCENVWVPDGPVDGGGTGGGWTSTPIQTTTNTDKEPVTYNWRSKLDEGFADYLELTTPLVKNIDLGGGIAVEQSNPDAYNCHYYTFNKTDKSAIIETLADQGNPLWVVAVNVKDANFFQVTSTVKVGDIVLYQVPSDGGVRLSHSGIVSGVDTQGFATEITSKMGEYEIIKHHPRDVPSDYGPTDPTFQSGGQTHLSRIYYRRR